MTYFIMAVNFDGATSAWSSAREIVLWKMAAPLSLAFALPKVLVPLSQKSKSCFLRNSCVDQFWSIYKYKTFWRPEFSW